jgi:hypothetical protein
MSEEREKRGGAPGPVAFVTIGLLVLLPVLYVLSDGPALWLYHRGYLSLDAFQMIYAPLRWACQRCPPLANAVACYNSWFLTEEMRQLIHRAVDGG